MHRYAILMPGLLLLLTACATAPSAPQVICPKLPALEEMEPEPSFTERMRNFLQGKLPAPTNSESPSISAEPPTTLRATP